MVATNPTLQEQAAKKILLLKAIADNQDGKIVDLDKEVGISKLFKKPSGHV
jgi:hypothetical protein